MKFIVSMGVRKLPGSPQPMHEIYRDFLEEAVLAEELGFDAVWASEHHFSPDAWSPSPVPFLAAAAARTQRIRIGTYVLLLPLHNPVHIAEDFAVLDNIRAGASIAGRGLGRRKEVPEVYVHAIEGRTKEQKRALIKDITDTVVRNFDVTADAVLVEIIESSRDNKAKGGVPFSER